MKRTQTFTLVEALVVMVVMAVLMWLFLLSLRTRRIQPHHHFSCTSNLKQIGLSALMYAQDYDNTYPEVREHYRQRYIDISTPGDSWYGLINVYNNNEKAFVCPGDKAQVNAVELMGEDGGFRLSYGFNAVCDAPDTPYGTWSASAVKCADEPPHSFTRHQKPDATLMIADAGQIHGVLYPYAGKEREERGHLVWRHAGDRFNVVFFDGHASSFGKDLNTRTPEKIRLGLTSMEY